MGRDSLSDLRELLSKLMAQHANTPKTKERAYVSINPSQGVL